MYVHIQRSKCIHVCIDRMEMIIIVLNLLGRDQERAGGGRVRGARVGKRERELEHEHSNRYHSSTDLTRPKP